MMKKWAGRSFDLILVLLLLVGISYRLRWINWSQGTNLHPDEYGLTGTLTQLRIPDTLGDYFNTRLSAISPYMKYDLAGRPTGDGPDNRLRWGQWPLIIIRYLAEATDNTGYDEMRLLGRRLSGFADIFSLLMIYLIGRRLFEPRTALLAAAFSSLAVMQIQQSHFMTVDNFGTAFVMLGLYACVRLAQRPCAARSAPPAALPGRRRPYRFDRRAWLWCLLFGLALGMALASKINLLPLAGMLAVALFLSIADLRIKTPRDLFAILWIAAAHLVLAALVAVVTFRVAHPMAFRAATGDTTFWTFHLNEDWVESMKVAQMESSGQGGGPPAEQWAHRTAILFPLVNIVFWGLGLPLGLAAWGGFLAAAWRFFRPADEWHALLLPLIWTGGYFLFMGTRWVKSVRYFLPIYPFLCLFAAWLLLRLWRWARRRDPSGGLNGRLAVAGALLAVVLAGTFGWATAFTAAVYRVDHTRIQAAKWIYENVPAPFHLTLDGGYQPVGAPDGLLLQPGETYRSGFTAMRDGAVLAVALPHISAAAPSRLKVQVAVDPDGQTLLAETIVAVPAGDEVSVSAPFENGALLADGQTYYLLATALDAAALTVSRTTLSNESWDEGLPMPFAGQDPFGQLYRGMEMEVRWYDDENKRQMFLERLAEVDYIILPSQRGIWSSCRLPDMYPMTMAYYRALFNGSLGFEPVAFFTEPFRLGALHVSDVGGTLAWSREPKLPLFNNNLLAAEEAFSVYDHPPVWIFRKSAGFDLQAAQAVLGSIDLTRVEIQSPREATGVPCQE
ncbi:MAG: ArnT family glycosyltransferase [Chloroflexota bacterium]